MSSLDNTTTASSSSKNIPKMNHQTYAMSKVVAQTKQGQL